MEYKSIFRDWKKGETYRVTIPGTISSYTFDALVLGRCGYHRGLNPCSQIHIKNLQTGKDYCLYDFEVSAVELLKEMEKR